MRKRKSTITLNQHTQNKFIFSILNQQKEY